MKAKSSKLIGWLMVLSLGLPFAVPTGLAQSGEQQPSAKVTAKTANFTLIPETVGTGDWVTILTNNIKTAEQKDLFVTVALETGLYTKTQVIGTGSSTAKAGVQVRVLVDGAEIEPGPITYADRQQQLSSLLLPAEMIELIQRTMAAASFSWVGIDIPQGVHTISVQARVQTDGSGTFAALGGVGKGTMTVESVRLIRDEDVVADPPLVP